MGFNTFPCNPYPISTEELNKGNNDDLNTRVATLEGDVSDLNSNKANQITIAPFFNAETAYTAGDLVYYNGLTYRCTNDHEGAWDADDFAATTIANELDTLKSGLANQKYVKIEENVSLTDTVTTVTIQSIANMDMLIFYPKVNGTIRGSLILPYEIFTRPVDHYIPIIAGDNAGTVYIRYVSDTSISVLSTLSSYNYMEIWGNS